ncbi:MAG TPA: hypothetical protein VMY78_13490 [Solirubrobacteraceae bacterium]|nr:hypothetical protein [Solirubrobacteraceae bacterium]
MPLSRSRTTALLAAGLTAGSLSFAVAAVGHGGGGGRHGGELRTSLVPSLPGDPAIHGVSPGGAPWVLDRSRVRLRAKGKDKVRLRVRVRGLVIPAPQGNNTAGGVTTITASVFCGSSTAPAATTTAVPLSQAGNARLDQKLKISGACPGAVVLVHPNGNLTRYIASSR